MTREIEMILEHQPLRRPSAGLDRRIDALLDGVDTQSDAAPWTIPPRPSVMKSWIGFGAGLAAAVALAAWVTLNFDGPASYPVVNNDPPQQLQPIRIEQTWTELESGQLTWVDESSPLRPIRQRVIERTQWIDPKDNVRIELMVPREQLMYVSTPAY